MNPRSNYFLSLFVLAFLSAPVHAERYTNNPDGTVTDNITGLMWDQCSWGQTWVPGPACLGLGSNYDFSEAQRIAANANSQNGGSGYKGHNDWRLPNRTELVSLIKPGAWDPSIDTAAFPNTVRKSFWSSTVYAPDPAFGWNVDFGDGDATANYQTLNFDVRLVRGGKSHGAFDAQAKPAVTAEVTADNKVYDGNATATISGCHLMGVTTGDTVTCSAASASFNSADAGTGKTVTAKGISLGGANAAKYQLTNSTATTTADITKATQSSLIIASNPAALSIGGIATISSTGGTTGGDVTYEAVGSPGGLICSINGSTLTVSGVPGTCSVSGTMLGNANYQPVMSSVLSVVVTDTNSTALVLSSTAVTYGTAVTVNATVTGQQRATGELFFYDRGRHIASKSLSKGLASIRKLFPAGLHILTAQYVGDANNPGSTSLPVTLVVAKAEQARLVLRAKPAIVESGKRSILKVSGGTGTGNITFETVAEGAAICRIKGNTLITSGSAGKCVVKAIKVAKNPSYNPIMSNSVTVEVFDP